MGFRSDGLSDRFPCGLALYRDAFPSLINKIGAIAVDMIILVAGLSGLDRISFLKPQMLPDKWD